MSQNSISKRSTCSGIVNSSLITTGRSSGAQPRIVITSLKRMTLLRKILFTVNAAIAFVSNVWMKSTSQLVASKLRNGMKKKSQILKILLGLRLIASHVLSVTQTSRKIKVVCTWPVDHANMISAGYVSENGKNTGKKQVDTMNVIFIVSSRKRIKKFKNKNTIFNKAKMKCSATFSITKDSITMANLESSSKNKW